MTLLDDAPMTSAQRAYLDSLVDDLGVSVDVMDQLTSSEAVILIDELRQRMLSEN